METIEKSVDVLNDLIQINNDRVAGFEKALADITDENVDLKSLFQEYAEQSRKYSQELTVLVANNAGEVETDTSAAGSLHRVWIDIKSLFGGSDRASILSEAERGEDAIKKAYQDAITANTLSTDVLSTVSEQSQGINEAHNKIKALRDIAKS